MYSRDIEDMGGGKSGKKTFESVSDLKKFIAATKERDEAIFAAYRESVTDY